MIFFKACDELGNKLVLDENGNQIINSPAPVPTLKSITDQGLITIAWDRDMKVKTENFT